jgi:hypothetical protein
MNLNDPKISSALQVFKDEETRIVAKLEGLKTQERTLQLELRRVRAALSPFSETPSAKQSMSDSEVVAFLEEELQRAPQPEASLKKAVLAHAKARSFSGTGIPLAMKRVLKSGKFTRDGENIALAKEALEKR